MSSFRRPEPGIPPCVPHLDRRTRLRQTLHDVSSSFSFLSGRPASPQQRDWTLLTLPIPGFVGGNMPPEANYRRFIQLDLLNIPYPLSLSQVYETGECVRVERV